MTVSTETHLSALALLAARERGDGDLAAMILAGAIDDAMEAGATAMQAWERLLVGAVTVAYDLLVDVAESEGKTRMQVLDELRVHRLGLAGVDG